MFIYGNGLHQQYKRDNISPGLCLTIVSIICKRKEITVKQFSVLHFTLYYSQYDCACHLVLYSKIIALYRNAVLLIQCNSDAVPKSRCKQ